MGSRKSNFLNGFHFPALFPHICQKPFKGIMNPSQTFIQPQIECLRLLMGVLTTTLIQVRGRYETQICCQSQYNCMLQKSRKLHFLTTSFQSNSTEQ